MKTFLHMEGATGTRVTLNGKEYLYFAGTSYFQLHSHPAMIKAAVHGLETYGTGVATSRSLTGTTPELDSLEQEIAAYFGTEDAAYLPSGYLSNLAGLAGLNQHRPYQCIFLDECAHYSLREAALATGKPVVEFPHLNPEALEKLMNERLGQDAIPLVASDGLFPVSASLAPARIYRNLAQKHGGMVWLDDAHGVGILGKSGRGSAEELGLDSEDLYFGATLSKAFGAYGGFIPGDSDFITQVKKSGAFVGSNSPPSAAVASARKGLELAGGNSGFRMRLRANAAYLKEGLIHLGIPIPASEIPIASFTAGDRTHMESIHQSLMEDGIYIQHTSYKGAGSEGVLRIVVSSEHSQHELDLLLNSLGKYL